MASTYPDISRINEWLNARWYQHPVIAVIVGSSSIVGIYYYYVKFMSRYRSFYGQNEELLTLGTMALEVCVLIAMMNRMIVTTRYDQVASLVKECRTSTEAMKQCLALIN